MQGRVVLGRLGPALARPLAAASLVIVLLAAILALTAPLLPLPRPDAMEWQPYLPPGAGHLFGTDNFGRDVLSRVVWGARVALLVALGASGLATLMGVALGAVAGYCGGWADAVLSRGFDVFLLVPTFFLVLLAAALVGSSLPLTVVAIAITTWPRPARIMRAQVLSLSRRTFVQAALAAGASHRQALLRHVVPNALAPIVTDATLLMGLAVLTEASLSFLGLGDPDTVSWGLMIFEGQRQLRLAPWMSIYPGLALLVVVAALNLLGDALNVALNPGSGQGRRQRHGERRGQKRGVRLAPPTPSTDAPLLAVERLTVGYGGPGALAVDGVSLRIERGDSLGIVGESGSGKSTLGAALLQILPDHATVGGTVRFRGETVLHDGAPVLYRDRRGTRRALDAHRWTGLAMVFQGAMHALNPVLTVRRQLAEAFRLHHPGASRAEVARRLHAVCESVGLPPARLTAYPHELSGGMRQRAVIALGLSCGAELVVADEPTTALDALVKDGILGEIESLRRDRGVALILISHDMGAVAETCERIAVMYAGQVVESGTAAQVFGAPAHPYTQTLIAALPRLTGPVRPPRTVDADGRRGALCRFEPRCPRTTELCRREHPAERCLAPGHLALCHHATPAHAEA